MKKKKIKLTHNENEYIKNPFLDDYTIEHLFFNEKRKLEKYFKFRVNNPDLKDKKVDTFLLRFPIINCDKDILDFFKEGINFHRNKEQYIKEVEEGKWFFCCGNAIQQADIADEKYNTIFKQIYDLIAQKSHK